MLYISFASDTGYDQGHKNFMIQFSFDSTVILKWKNADIKRKPHKFWTFNHIILSIKVYQRAALVLQNDVHDSEIDPLQVPWNSMELLVS